MWKLIAAAIVFAHGTMSWGATLLFDDFDEPPASGGSLSISVEDERSNFKSLLQPNVTDVSVRTQLRVTEGLAGALIRWNSRQPVPNGYYGLIRADGTARLGWVGGTWPVLREVATGLDPSQRDVVLQLEANGNQLKLWMWPEGEPMPNLPTLSVADDAVAWGSIALGGVSTDFPHRGPINGVFRYALVTDTLAPEPSMAALWAFGSTSMLLRRGRAAHRRHIWPP
jgi:hypothetical protein